MTGTGRLVRLLLRRDRVVLPLWVIVLALVPAGYVASFEGLFPTTVSAGGPGGGRDGGGR